MAFIALIMIIDTTDLGITAIKMAPQKSNTGYVSK